MLIIILLVKSTVLEIFYFKRMGDSSLDFSFSFFKDFI